MSTTEVLTRDAIADHEASRGSRSSEAVGSPVDGEATASAKGTNQGVSGAGSAEGIDLSAEPVAAAWDLVQRLSAAPTLEDRIPIYATSTRRLIFIAAARWPDLMPELNGDIEIRALLSAELS